MTNNNLSSPLKFHDALRLYNAATFCYLIPSDAIEGDCLEGASGELEQGGPKLNDMQWRKDAFDEWSTTIPEDTKFEGKYLVPVRLTAETFQSSNWFGLGVENSTHPVGIRKEEQHEAGLISLIAQHRQLRDHVHRRANGPRQSSDHYDIHGLIRRQQNMHPVVSPVCRAVLVLATTKISNERRILLVLTGENEGLMGPVPTFDSICNEKIFARHGSAAVEVSISTAMHYIRSFDTEEEKFNHVLRSTTRRRHEAVKLSIYEEAVQRIDEMAYVDLTGKRIEDYFWQRAIRTVLHSRGIQPVSRKARGRTKAS